MNSNTVDAKILGRMFLSGAKNLEAKKEWINELNVFPVPDGDTGTNMTLTIMSAASEVNALSEPDMKKLAKAISSGSLRGARGNSGVILSQLLRGFTKVIEQYEEIDAPIFAKSFEKAVETAYKAVMKPTEGTILTVARMAAEQAKKIADRTIVVLPTRTIPQGITAMLSFDGEASADENAVAMMQAADHVSTGLITFAARDSDFDGKKIKKGEILALENGKLVATGTDITKTTYRLARSMCKKDTSFITVISGCDVSEEDAQRTANMVQAKCPAGIEVTHITGGQPVYYYMLSVE